MSSIIEYSQLETFEALDNLRDLIARSSQMFKLNGLPISIDIPTSEDFSHQDASGIRRLLERVTHQVFSNLSHALNLPWEKYLSDLHDLSASGNSELHVITREQPVLNKWSTITLVMNSGHPDQIMVLFGEALSVFADQADLSVKRGQINVKGFGWNADDDLKNWVVYYVRPNDNVMYTRTAGALMKPLSSGEYIATKRVGEILRKYNL